MSMSRELHNITYHSLHHDPKVLEWGTAFPHVPSAISARFAKALPPQNIDHSKTQPGETVRTCARFCSTDCTGAFRQNNFCTSSSPCGAHKNTVQGDPSAPPAIISPSNKGHDEATILLGSHSETNICIFNAFSDFLAVKNEFIPSLLTSCLVDFAHCQ